MRPIVAAPFSHDPDHRLVLLCCGDSRRILDAGLFKLLDPHLVAGIVGIFTLLFLAQRLAFPPRQPSPPPPRWVHQLYCPLGRPANQRLCDPAAALADGVRRRHGVNVLSHQHSELDSLRMAEAVRLAQPVHHNGAAALCAIGCLGGAGRIAIRIKTLLFYRMIYAGMLLTGLKRVWDAWGVTAWG